MTYATGKPGQTVYYARNHWEQRREVVLVRYYKFRPDLMHNNCAIVEERGLQFSVDIKDLFRKAK